ncbi:hypothetical protein [Zoogloea sp. LCSB751]|uniref:hypothetical protein n=1 Tax=Zoogloea sp. LCSB751 TaxID=1965277 RepID=UPI001116A055|nr:hypothetical protein [Zoogloea sp. LCSB751]
MMIAMRRLAALAFALAVSTSTWSADLTGQWDLKIEDKDHRVITTLVIEFTNETARSCIAGGWRRVNVVSASTKDADFYPVSDPQSFRIKDGQLTIGRNQICDNYLRLQGPLNGESARGDYYGFSIGGSWPRGFFTLDRRGAAK